MDLRATIVIPSYWGRKSTEPFNPQDAVYDHPNPLDFEGTLERALQSIRVLENRDFNVVVLAVATTPEIAEAVEEKVRGITSKFKDDYPIACISHEFEGFLKRKVNEAGLGSSAELVSLTGYSNIRNMCLIACEIARSEVAVFMDDDEVYEDAQYLDKVFENIGKPYEGKTIGAIAGYYLQPKGGWKLEPQKDWWMAEWPMVRAMNEAFEIIASEPRLKLTPFVFGGNMAVEREVFRRVPFDPNVRRGEDIDYLVDCKFFDIDFLLDSKLAIRHLPPKSYVPPWRRFREDIYRFIYAREKLRKQDETHGLRQVSIEELDPYPGCCMRDNLEDLIYKTSVLMGLHAMQEGDKLGFDESMNNIFLARYDAPPSVNPYSLYLEMVPQWERLMDFLAKEDEPSEMMFEEMGL